MIVRCYFFAQILTLGYFDSKWSPVTVPKRGRNWTALRLRLVAKWHSGTALTPLPFCRLALEITG